MGCISNIPSAPIDLFQVVVIPKKPAQIHSQKGLGAQGITFLFLGGGYLGNFHWTVSMVERVKYESSFGGPAYFQGLC